MPRAGVSVALASNHGRTGDGASTVVIARRRNGHADNRMFDRAREAPPRPPGRAGAPAGRRVDRRRLQYSISTLVLRRCQLWRSFDTLQQTTVGTALRGGKSNRQPRVQVRSWLSW